MFYPIISGYIFFSNAHRTFATIDHILGYKLKLHKFKRIQAIQNMFSVPSFIKLEIHNRKIWKIHKYL